MKSIALGILVFGIFFGPALRADERGMPNNFTPIDTAVNWGLNLDFASDLSLEIGSSGTFYLQGGKTVAKGDLKDDTPYCKVTPESPISEEMTRYYFREGQPLLVNAIERSEVSFSLFGANFGFGKGSFKIHASGTIEDARTVLKPESEIPALLAETQTHMQKLTFECSDFPSPEILGYFREVVGREKFTVAARRSDIGLLISRSSELKRIRTEKERKEAEQKAKIEAEQQQALDAERVAAGSRASTEMKVSALAQGDSFQVGNDSVSTIIPRGDYLGSIYQKGEQVGASSQAFEPYEVVGKTLDLEAPYCTVIAMRFKASSREQTVKVGPGFYEVQKIDKLAEDRYSISLQGNPRTQQGRTPTLTLVCINVNTVGEIEAAIGPALITYAKKADLKEAVQGASDTARALAQDGGSNGSDPRASQAEQKPANPGADPAAPSHSVLVPNAGRAD